MARHITRTLILEGELVAETPLHIGGADTSSTTDMPLAINGKGEYYLPGTSIAGAIRAWEQSDDENSIWGYAQDDQGHASYLIIDDAPALNTPAAELWHGVGIDRRTGAAAEGIKFDRQVLPQGTRFKFRLSREVGAGQTADGARQQLGRLLAALEQGEIPFGGGVTRGFGRLCLKNPIGQEVDWNTKQGLLHWLTDQSKPETAMTTFWRKAAELDNTPDKIITIEIHWQPTGPLMVKAATDGINADILPFVSRTHENKLALTLPGSAIKGALRQQSERIIRTVTGRHDIVASGQHFDQVEVPLVRELFGVARPADEEQKIAGRGLLSVDTCYAKLALTSDQWGALDRSPHDWEDKGIHGGQLYKADHVAIDRWTGGASDGALFNTVEPDRTVAWSPIRLRFDYRRGKDQLATLALLWLVLRDFAAGKVPLGYGANRGYGDLMVEQITFRGVKALGHDQDAITIQGTGFDDSPMTQLLKPVWTRWLAGEHKEGA